MIIFRPWKSALNKAPGLTDTAVQKRLEELAQKLSAGRKQFDQEAMRAIAHLSAVFPLLADAQRFVDLAERQRDLAGRRRVPSCVPAHPEQVPGQYP